MYTVYLHRMTVESRDQIVHHRSLDLKKPAVRRSQFQEYPTQAPLSICQLVRFQGGGHLSLRVCPGMLHRDQFIVYSSSQKGRRREKTKLKKNRLDNTITTTTNNNNSLYCALDTKSVKTLRNGPDKNDGNNGNEHVGMQKRC